jgi:hypothetical protein
MQLYYSYNSEAFAQRKKKKSQKKPLPQPKKEEKKQSKPYNKVIDSTAVTQKD